MPSPTPDQIRADLRGEFRGRLHFDAVRRNLYATDASPFQVTPLGVAVPLDAADLCSLVKYAQENAIPLVPRGAGTGLAGESLGPGLVVDLSVNFRGPPVVGPECVTAGVGMTHADLNAALAPHGRRFAPDPASSAACTVGGMVATNASGGNAFRHGYTRDHVVALDVVWDSGEASVVSTPAHHAKAGQRPEDRPTHDPGLRFTEIRSQAAGLLAANREMIQVTRPLTRYNRCGYVLHDVLTPAGIDLPRLLTGSEGTLAFTTAATFRTIPVAGGMCLTVLGFPALDAGLRAGLSLRGANGLAGCDLLDARQLAIARTLPAGEGVDPIPAGVGAALVLTFEGDSERAAAGAGRDATARLTVGRPFTVLAAPTCDPDGVARVRRFREAGVAGLYALGRGPRPIAFVEDAAVPAEELPRFVADVQEVLRRFDLAGSVLVHVLAGVVHTRPFVDLADPADRAKLWPVAEAVHGLALAVGGTVSGQHGTGLARTPWIEKQYGPLMPVLRELKRIFDPKGLLNPGKIIGPDPSRPAWPLREVAGGPRPAAGETPDARPARLSLPTTDDRPPAAASAEACNGCGDCRTRTPPTRMCPVFHALGDEAASPRAKANLVRQLLHPDPADRPDPDDVRAVADLCVNCKMCRSECRAGIDIPRLMLDAKAADYEAHGLHRGDWALARVESLSALAGNFAFSANRLLGNRVSRWALELLFGLSRKRTLPRFTHRTFLRRAKRAGLTQRFQVPAVPGSTTRASPVEPGTAGTWNKVALFVDGFTNYNDPLIGEAAVAVLRRNGFAVHVPPRLYGTGTAALAHGDVESAREMAGHNVRVLADLVRDGYRVVCTDPTAAVALAQEYPALLDDPDARLVADNTVELTALLWELHAAGRLRTDFARLDLTLGHHVPCHLKALGGPAAGPKLLELIPGVRVRTIDVSCSGMAGVWGLSAANREASLRAGAPMLAELARPGVLFGSTECGPCRMQMQDGGRKRTLHPVQYLALAYGLLPELGVRLTKPLGDLVTD